MKEGGRERRKEGREEGREGGKKGGRKEEFLLVMRILRTHSINNFPIYHTAVLLVVTTVYITSLVHLSYK